MVMNNSDIWGTKQQITGTPTLTEESICSLVQQHYNLVKLSDIFLLFISAEHSSFPSSSVNIVEAKGIYDGAGIAIAINIVLGKHL